MDVCIVVLRPGRSISTQVGFALEFRPKHYDLLLVDHKVTDRNKQTRQLPKFVCYEEDVDLAALNYLATFTGVNGNGLSGKRALLLPAPDEDEPNMPFQALVLIPVSEKDKVSAVVEEPGARAKFHPLDQVLECLHLDTGPLNALSRQMIGRLELWFRGKCREPCAIEALFRVHADARLGQTTTNPVFSQDRGRPASNEAFANLMAIEKCDIVIMNPLFGSGLPLPYKPQLEEQEASRTWKPRLKYHKSTSSSGSDSSGGWTEEFPLHKCACAGQTQKMQELLAQGYSPTEMDRDSWAPIHYAAMYGQLGAIQVLLNHGSCPPNIENSIGWTPLHFAAHYGHSYVVELLLNHPSVNINSKDKDGKAPVDLCVSSPKTDWQACAKLLQRAANQTPKKMQVSLLDGSNMMLNLEAGKDTTVQQLQEQLMRELQLPEAATNVFAFWVCSPHLQLQLKMDHKPWYHLDLWQSSVVNQLTDLSDTSREQPKLYLRRDARLSVSEEREVISRCPTAVSLLFHEAHDNYISSNYPCSDQEAAILAAIFLQYLHGDYDGKKTKTYLAKEEHLERLIPKAKMRASKGTNWVSKIVTEYKQLSSRLKDKSQFSLQYKFLSFCWHLDVYGSALFQGIAFTGKGALEVQIGVNCNGIHLINYHTKVMFETYAFKSVEWMHSVEPPYVEVRVRGSASRPLRIRTKQAHVISQLMTKLSQQPPAVR
ncbi:PREDICTED: krev interaction trapped protein 1-like [Priapulus caudatus]|uniref:Krev interaction trapped protein 1-like n=1 Tax=Priapulus caudatus TaxID=37621 RepID=A0ABM1DWA1_PRICU|nr:PREDICTED: krev interaction trapped protein 1-like [Priapulus caudatus]XP_014664223.1 PREDICTED: krev interaction trapped protein 1-like [Priapulus caudatus]XP_014664224.1 PREDICTED: krev interaction trapped protein 1-like [Priapulus caudatus]